MTKTMMVAGFVICLGVVALGQAVAVLVEHVKEHLP